MYILPIIEVIGFFILLLHGTFIMTKYFRYAKGMFAFVIIGALFKIQHYPYSNMFITVGWLGILLIYGFSFTKKPIKNALDFLKLLCVIFSVPKIILDIFHYPYVDIFTVLSSVTILLALIFFFLGKKDKRRLNITFSKSNIDNNSKQLKG